VYDVALVLKAMKFAEKAHAGQKRRGSGQPYFYHAIAVGFILVAHKGSKYLAELLCAAILHDTLEDTDLSFETIAKEFGSLVASLVRELTNDEEEIQRIGKLAYHKKKLVGMSSYGLYLKLADRLHNVSDNPSEQMMKETIELVEHLKKKRRLTKGQKALVEEILSVCNRKK
jgi:guanosine-3',5'-bis(diphosphate) 3'-pyrophosphohydrolase